MLLLLLLAQACGRARSAQLQDTEGRRCAARPRDGDVTGLVLVEPPLPGASFRLERNGYLVAVCPSAQGNSGSPAQCRGLVCQTNQDCPPAHGLEQGTCINGLCIEPSHPIGANDAIMLCLAGTGVGSSSPTQAERFALGLNCGQPCKVPTPCRQP